MICSNQYKLLGFLSMLLAVDAWFMDTWNGGEPVDEVIENEPIVLTTIDGSETLLFTVTEDPVPQNTIVETVVTVVPLPPQAGAGSLGQAGWLPPPVAPVEEPKIAMQPLRIETVHEERMIESVFHEVLPVSFLTSETWISTITEMKVLLETAFQRSTVTVTPPPMYTTRTKIVNSVHMVEAAAIRTNRMLISETQFTGSTVTSTSTRWRTRTTHNVERVTMEEQFIQTVWEPFTVTVTGLSTVTEWETRPFELLQVHRVRVPVVSMITSTTRIPHHKTMTNWITSTATSTILCP